MGRLTSGVNLATVTVSSWADDGNGGIQSGTQTTATTTVSKNDTAPIYL
jgi:hypothetical protein